MPADSASAARPPTRRARQRSLGSPSKWVLAAAAVACLLTANHALRMLFTERARVAELHRRQLAAAADDRRLAIDQWLEDQISDTELAAGTPALRAALAAVAGGAGLSSDDLRDLVANLPGANAERTLRLFDRDGTELAESVASPDGTPTAASVALTAIGAGRVIVEQQRFTEGDRRTFVFAAPVIAAPAGSQPASHERLGAVTLSVPAEVWLFPFLAHTPLPTATGETMIGERRGGEIVFLSPLRAGPAPGAVLTLGTGEPDLAMATALLGAEAVGDFVDHRGVPVVAATRLLRHAPWGLVVEVDRAEAFAAVGESPRVSVLELVSALLGLAALAGVAARSSWQGERVRMPQAELRFATLAEQANDAILMTDGEGRILEANRRAEALYGMSGPELRTRRLVELCAAPTEDDARCDADSTWTGAGRLVETVHVRKDGRPFPVEVSRRGFRHEGELRSLAVIRDLTERKASERRIRELNRLLRTQSLVNQALVSGRPRDAVLRESCRILVEPGGFATAWIGFLDPLAARLVPVALASEPGRDLDLERLRCDGSPARTWCRALVSGQRAVGHETALIERRDAASAAASARAADRRSEAAFPLHVRGQVVGVLGIQSASHAELASEDLELLDELSRDLANGIEASIDRDDLQHAEAQLRAALQRAEASAERFMSVFEHTPVGIGLSGLTTRVMEAINPTLARMLGYTPAELVGQPAELLWQPHEHERRAAIVAALRDGASDHVDFHAEFRHKDGSILPVHAIFTLVRGASGEPEHVLGVLEDERERRAADVRIRQLSRAVEQSPVSVVITDRQGTIDYVNRKFTEVTGYGAEEAIGQNPRILKSGNRSPSSYRELWATITSGGDWHGEFLNRRKGGQLFWEDAVISPLRDESGVITHFVAVKEDITARKAAEEELKRVQAHLTAAQKMDAIGRLAGGVAHDFNNILTAIQGFAELMLGDLSPADPHHESVTGVMDAARRATELTRQLLAFSRREVVVRAVLDANSVLANLEKMLRRLVGEHIQVVTDLAAGLAHVEADPGQLEQIVVNLAVNARDAMPDGGTLHIETANAQLERGRPELPPDVEPGAFVRIRIADTGAGMTSDVRERIFEPFFTTKARGRGTGLGLATVYGIVHTGGGFIEVSSELGHGTRFDVYLPAIDKPISAAPSASDVDVPGGSETILVVEDDEMVRTITARMLRGAGYRVLVASNPGEAYLIATEQRDAIDLMLTDVVMPLMNGRALAEKIRREVPDLPVIFMSGYTDDDSLRRAVVSDEVKFLQKPVSRATLLRAVRAVLDHARPRA